MEVGKYWKRFKSCRTYKDKCSLQQEVWDADNMFRKLFSQQRDSWVVPELDNPYESLIPVFDHLNLFKCLKELPEEAAVPKVFELGEQRKPEGTSSIIDKSSFTRNFSDLFTEGALKYLDWEGVFAAGGSIMACLQPLSSKHDTSNIARRRYMHDEGFPGSDVDLFLYGMDAEQAKKKIVQIYDAVREAVPFNVLCFRSAHTVTLVSEYPFRHIQIILRLYSSPLEVLTGFDVDSCAVGFDGSKVWMAQRCHSALVNQRNPINLTRRSPTYEMRLAKYAQRGFEVPVTELQRDRIDPTLFERSWNKVVGLAKLLLLERLRTPEARFRYREQQRTKKMRNMYSSAFARRFGMRGMLQNPWMASRMEKIAPTRQGTEASDYSTVFLPWGRGYNAQKCRSLMIAKDRILNDRYVSKGRKYKLHPCFIGTAEEVIEDCSSKDPSLPDDVDKKDLEGYVRGPLVFIEDDPGRQMIGSFHPIEDDDWSNGAYITVEMDELFIAANADNSEQLQMLLDSGVNPNSTDFTGRTPLHITAFSGSFKCAQILLEHNARMITRMADGRTVLHICAAYGHADMITMFLERSNQNAKASKAAQKSNADGDDKKGMEESAPADILDTNAQEWNHNLNPLQVAMVFGQVSTAEVLLKHGADPNSSWPLGETDDYDYEVAPGLSLVMSLSRWDLSRSEKLLQLLLKHGCDVARLDRSLQNILHIAAVKGYHEFIELILKGTPSMKEKGLNVISLSLKTPLMSAIEAGHEECVKALLHLGANLESTDDDCQLARRRSSVIHSEDWSTLQNIRRLSELTPPKMPYALWAAVTCICNNMAGVSQALKMLEDEEDAAAMGGRDHPTEVKPQGPFVIIKMLIDHGANVNHISEEHPEQTMVDYVKAQLRSLNEHLVKQQDKKQEILLRLKQEENNCSETTSTVDDILISCQTGLPASFNSQSKVRRLLQTINQDSYVLPMLEARALEEDAESLVREQHHFQKTFHESQITGYKNLLEILRDAGGVEYHKLMGNPDEVATGHKKDEDFNPDAEPAALTVEKVIGRYYLLPQEKTSSLPDWYHSSGRQGLGILLETRLQPGYHQLFEAVWQGDIEHVERVTLTGAPEERLLVCVQNSYGQTPLTLAVLRGHATLVAKLVEIASKQYVPEKKEEQNLVQKGPLETGRLNNFAVELLVNEFGGNEEHTDEAMDEDAEDEDSSDSFADDPEGGLMQQSDNQSAEESTGNVEVDNLLSEVAGMRTDAQKAAQSAAAKQAGVSADTGTEKVCLCHIPPEALLSHSGLFPAELVDCNLKEKWRFDMKRLIRLVWKFWHDPDDKVQEALANEYQMHGGSRHPYRRKIPIQAFGKFTPLELSILMKRVDILNILLDACELWDRKWSDEAVERAKLVTDASSGAPKDEVAEVEEHANEIKAKNIQACDQSKKPREAKNYTELSCRLVRSQGHRRQIQDLAILVDDPSAFSCLIARTGGCYDFGKFLTDLRAALLDEKKRLNKLTAKTDQSQAFEDNFTDVCQTLRAKTALHVAVMYGAQETCKWLLRGCGEESFGKFLAAKSNSWEASSAERLGQVLLRNQFVGISDQGSPEAALAAYYCGHVRMEDNMKRTAFHCAVAQGSKDMLQFLINTLRSLEQIDVALAVLNKPRVLEPQHTGSFSVLNSSSMQTSGTTPLQASALLGYVDIFNLLLDIGVDVRVPDGDTRRGWNLLAFCIAGKGYSSHLAPHISIHPVLENIATAHEMVENLVEHPRVGMEVAHAMVAECMGNSKITPFMLAASLENVAVVELLKGILLEGGYTHQSSEGHTVLHIAAKTGKPDIVNSLVSTKQPSPNPEEDSKLNAVRVEIAAAAAQEDRVGLAPVDITMEVVCASRRKKLKSRACMVTPSFYKADGDEDSDLRAYAVVREVCTLRKRIRSRFEDVQASALQAAEDAEKSEDGSFYRGAADLSMDVDREVAQMINRSSGGNNISY